SRPLLALSCAALGGALLINEAAYPLAALAPVLAWFRRPQRHRLPVWTYAWGGTLALFATGFLVFLAQRGAEAYQATHLTGVLGDPRLLLHNLRLRLQAGLATFETSGAVAQSWTAAAAALTLTAFLVCVAAWRGEEAPQRRRYLIVLGMAVVALVLG